MMKKVVHVIEQTDKYIVSGSKLKRESSCQGHVVVKASIRNEQPGSPIASVELLARRDTDGGRLTHFLFLTPAGMRKGTDFQVGRSFLEGELRRYGIELGSTSSHDNVNYDCPHTKFLERLFPDTGTKYHTSILPVEDPKGNLRKLLSGDLIDQSTYDIVGKLIAATQHRNSDAVDAIVLPKAMKLLTAGREI